MLGKLEGQLFFVDADKLDIIKDHITKKFEPYEPNDMMITRLQNALDHQQAIFGADASFYFHELREAELMTKYGYNYTQAHLQAIEDYQVSPFSLYHPDEFNNNWKKAWGILK